jgi:endonuclease-3
MPTAKASPAKKKTAAKARVSAKKSAKKPEPSRASGATHAPGVSELTTRLTRAVPEARCELAHRNAFQLLIATILSAQSTDRAVNSVTPELFKRWPSAKDLAAAPQEEVEVVVKRTGFFRNKAKAIRGAAEKLARDHGGEVPRSIAELVELPGVARKTANVVLGTAYGIASGFVVDTHVTRVSQRLGLTEHEDPPKIEQDLCKYFPERAWVDFGHRVLLHGRYTCLAKNPMCSACPLNELCASRQAAPEGTWQERAKAEAERVHAGFVASGVE